MLKLFMRDEKSRLVYSTEQDIPKKLKDNKIAGPATPLSANRLLVRLDRKGRGGKTVTLIEGLSLPIKDKELLLKQLKARLGTGGTMRDGTLEIQGEHRDTVITILEARGLKPKSAGG